MDEEESKFDESKGNDSKEIDERVSRGARGTRGRPRPMEVKMESFSNLDGNDSSLELVKPTGRRRGTTTDAGWAQSASDSKGRRSLDMNEEVQDVVESTTITTKNKHKADDDELILIPDLDEDGMDEERRVAPAPKNVNRKIPTFKELENDIKTVISSNELGSELGVLLNSLVPAEFLVEKDEQWTFDSLLQEVTEEYQKDSSLILSESNAGTRDE